MTGGILAAYGGTFAGLIFAEYIQNSKISSEQRMCFTQHNDNIPLSRLARLKSAKSREIYGNSNGYTAVIHSY